LVLAFTETVPSFRANTGKALVLGHDTDMEQSLDNKFKALSISNNLHNSLLLFRQCFFSWNARERCSYTFSSQTLFINVL